MSLILRAGPQFTVDKMIIDPKTALLLLLLTALVFPRHPLFLVTQETMAPMLDYVRI